MNKRLTKISKYLSFVLKHHPETIGLKPNADGWLEIKELVQNANAAGKTFTLEQVLQVVELSDVSRFSVNEEKTLIRAN